MAMISCKECGKEISSEAVTCPHCGAKTQHGKEVNAQKSLGVIGIIYIIMAIAGIWLLVSGFSALLDDISSWGRFHYGTYSFTDIEGGVLTQIIFGISLFLGGIVGARVAVAQLKYTYGTVQAQTESDGSGYKKIFDEMYGVVGDMQNITLMDPSTGKKKEFHVWKTRTGGKVACDSDGNYIYSTKKVSDYKIAAALLSHG